TSQILTDKQPQYVQQYIQLQEPYPSSPYQQNTTVSSVVISNTPHTVQTTVIGRRNELSGLDIVAVVMGVWHTFCVSILLGVAATVVSACAFVFRYDGNHNIADKLTTFSIGLSIGGFIHIILELKRNADFWS
ncbi:uncharacterized protein LOC144341769, partial [Saccoglossus kowalevskii]